MTYPAEALEPRRLLAVTTGQIGGLVAVTGSDAAETITLAADGGDLVVIEDAATEVGRFAFGTFDYVFVDAGGGDDLVTNDLAADADGVRPIEGFVNLAGGAGDDTLVAGLAYDRLDGGLGDDSLTADDGGENRLVGDAGNDTLVGAAGNDLLRGGVGDDVLIGNGGDDALFGDEENDSIAAGDGDDTVDGGEGTDAMAGGEGVDLIGYFLRDEPVQIDLFGGTAGSDGEDDDLAGDFENAIGGGGSDTLFGDDGDNFLFGGVDLFAILSGDGDVLFGRGGADTLLGGAGDDLLDAGDGDDIIVAFDLTDGDTIRGGAGNDAAFVDGNDSPADSTGVEFATSDLQEFLDYLDDDED